MGTAAGRGKGIMNILNISNILYVLYVSYVLYVNCRHFYSVSYAQNAHWFELGVIWFELNVIWFELDVINKIARLLENDAIMMFLDDKKNTGKMLIGYQ